MKGLFIFLFITDLEKLVSLLISLITQHTQTPKKISIFFLFSDI